MKFKIGDRVVVKHFKTRQEAYDLALSNGQDLGFNREMLPLCGRKEKIIRIEGNYYVLDNMRRKDELASRDYWVWADCWLEPAKIKLKIDELL
jgi:hypothetical protein